MYKVPDYTEKDTEKIYEFMQQHPFVILTGSGERFPVATHLPVEVSRNEDGEGYLHRAYVQLQRPLSGPE